jgi:sugar lactone lactonase YvrE
MGSAAKIVGIDPPYAVAGGEIVIDCTGFDTREPSRCAVLIGDAPASIVALGPRRVLVIVPETKGGRVPVILRSGDQDSETAYITVARKLAGDLHPVANPAFDPDDGALFVTRSGSRGEELPVTLFRIDISGDVSEYSGDIANPTGIAFSPDGQMFVTSRLEGVVYKINPFKEGVMFARNLGVATGIAFDQDGLLHVGDRTGTIFKVNGIGEERAWTQLEPSVSAFHLAFGLDDSLYVAGPTVTSFDSIWRINPDGDIEMFFKGLGRPQGLAFDRDGNLYVAAAFRGRRGIVRISPDGSDAKLVVAGINLIGLAFSATGEMAVVSIDSVYSLPMQIKGTLLR